MPVQRLLLVDDEIRLLEVCRDLFEHEGYEVLTASNGHDALSQLENHPVDLVVTDLKMPKLDGQTLLKSIVSLRPGLPVVVLTGYGTVENSVECLKLGAADYLLKPFELDELLRKVRDVLTKPTPMENGAAARLQQALAAGESLAKQSDPRGLLRALADVLTRLFQPDDMLFYRCDDSEGRLRVAGSNGPAFTEPRIQNTLTARLENGLQDRQGLYQGSELQTPDLGCCMVSPLPAHETPPYLMVLHRAQGRPLYGVEDLRLLSLLASQAGALMEVIHASHRLNGVNIEIVTSLAHAVEAKDYYTRGHSERVSAFAGRLGRVLGLGPAELNILKQAAMLHDVGKIGVPDNILNKPGPLNDEEQRIIRRHPSIGRDILSHVSGLKPVLEPVYYHHERVDGSGYPEGLASGDIPQQARIIAIVDGFEAIISHRAYHRARSQEEAQAILRNGAGKQWDAEYVDAWLGLTARHSVEELAAG